eukprot:scaffold4455_cov403-Prasinococcus_capsulatus_cf.AAC.3
MTCPGGLRVEHRSRRGAPGKMELLTQTSQGHSRTIYALDASHAHNAVATIGGDNRLCIFDWAPEAGKLELSQCLDNAHPLDGNSVRWQPKLARLLATGGDDGTVRLWKVLA